MLEGNNFDNSNQMRGDKNRRDRSRSPIGGSVSGESNRKDRDKFGRPVSTKQVCVANIPYTMTWQEVKDLFRNKVGDVNYVRLFEDENGRSRGMGIVEFSQPSAVTKALKEMHRHEIDGRKIVVKEDYDVERDRYGKPVNNVPDGQPNVRSGNDRRARSPEVRRKTDQRIVKNSGSFNPNYNTYGLSLDFLNSLNIKGPLINRVFISNVDYNVSERKLREVFKMAGIIENFDFMKDKTGKSRGRSIIEFSHPVEAVQAISMFHNQKLFGRAMSVEMDKLDKNYADNTRTFNILPGGLKGVGRGLGVDGNPLDYKSESFSQSSSQYTQDPSMSSSMTSNVETRNDNVNFGSGPQALSNLGLTQQQIVALVKSGLISGSAANNLSSNGNSLSGVMNSDPQPLFPSNSTIPSLTSMDPNIPFQSSSSQVSFPGDDRRLNRNDKMDFNDSNRSNTVIVRNLPYTYTWENLKNKFYEIGDVVFAEIKNRGCGLVRFSLPRDALRAVNLMNGTRINGRPVDVQLY